MYKFKGTDLEIKSYSLCLGNTSKDFIINNNNNKKIKQNKQKSNNNSKTKKQKTTTRKGLNWYVYDFSAHNVVFDYLFNTNYWIKKENGVNNVWIY